MNVEVVLAWPRRFESVRLDLPEGTTVGEAVERSGLPLDAVVAIAVHGLFLLGLLGIASYLVFGCLLQVRPIGVRGWLAIVTAGWWCAMAAWLVVLWLFPGG